MSEASSDYSEFADHPSPNEFRVLNSLVDRMAALKRDGRQGSKEYQTLAEVEVPEVMPHGMLDHRTPSGVHIVLEAMPHPRIAVRGELRDQMHRWLEEQGHLVPLSRVRGPFRTKRGKLDQIARKRAEQEALGELARQLLTNGAPVDLALLGVSRVSRARILDD